MTIRTPRFSSLVDRIAGERTDAWDLHTEASRARQRGEDVIPLTIGDPDFPTPAPFTEAAIAALHAGDTHYPELIGRLALRAAVARHFQARTGVTVGPENVAIASGAQNALFSAAQCLAEAGTEVLVLDPMYVTYDATIRATGAKLVMVPPRPDGSFRVDLEALADAVTPATRAIFFATPNNPTGVVFDRAELEGIAAIAKRHDIWVVADEVYGELTFDREHLSIAALPGMDHRTVTISSVSKSHAMTGWRSGWAIAPAPLARHMSNLSLCMNYGQPGFIQQAVLAALTHGEHEVHAMRDVYRRRRDLMSRMLAGVPGLRCLKPEAGMFMLVDVKATGLSGKDFAWDLYRETGVALLDASPFGNSTVGYLRCAFTIEDAMLEEACRRIARFAERFHNRPSLV